MTPSAHQMAAVERSAVPSRRAVSLGVAASIAVIGASASGVLIAPVIVAAMVLVGVIAVVSGHDSAELPTPHVLVALPIDRAPVMVAAPQAHDMVRPVVVVRRADAA